MTRRKARILGIVALLALAAGIAVVALRSDSPREKYGRVKRGMTYDEVIKILGQPRRDELNEYGPRYRDCWWLDRNCHIWLGFDSQNRVDAAAFSGSGRPDFLNRVLRWFGL